MKGVREGGMNIVERMIMEFKNELAKVAHKGGSIKWEFSREKVGYVEGEALV